MILTWLVWALTFPKLSFGWLAFVALIPVLGQIQKRDLTLRQGFAWGLFMALVPMLVLHRWIFALSVWVPWGYLAVLWAGFCAYQSLFYGLALMGYVATGKRLWTLPFWWVGFEWLRSLGPIGSTGGVMAMSQVSVLPILQWASVLGLWGLSFVIIAINAYGVWAGRSWVKWLGFGAILMCLWWGGSQMMWGPEALAKRYPEVQTVAIIQGNHPQSEKMSEDSYLKIRETYTQMTAEVMQNAHPDLVVWPETVTPYFNLEDRAWMQVLQGMVERAHSALMFGTAVRGAGHNVAYNAVVTFLPGQLQRVYRKVRLMPFGEYWPCRRVLKWIGVGQVMGTDDFSAAKTVEVMKLPQLVVGPSVCLESIYPNLSRESVRNGAQVLVNVANNAWFGDSIAMDLHFDMARMRAVENRRYWVQCANTGQSGIIDPCGRVVAQLTPQQRGVVLGEVRLRSE